MIEELVSRMFYVRNHAHLQHWAETSGYKHGVLGDFYDDLIDSVDSFVEAYQGNHGQLSVFDLEPYKVEDEFLSCLEENTKWLVKSRDDICDGVTALENLYDGITDLFLSTRYKLKSFK